MSKDYKTGMLVGLVLVIGAGITLSLHPSLGIRASITGLEKAGAETEQSEPGFPANLTGNGPTTEDANSAREEVKIIEGPKYHAVSNGETLSGISFQYYGTENKWQKILDANKNTIRDVKNLKPGMRLIIPE